MRTWLRRIAGLLLFPVAWWFYVTLWVRTTFSCDRATAVCMLSTERRDVPPATTTIPLGDVLGAYMEHTDRTVVPGAAEILARARTIRDVDVGTLYSYVPRAKRHSGERVTIYTRRGIVPMTPNYPQVPDSADTAGFNIYITSQKPGRFEMVVDESLHANIGAIATCILGVALIVLPKQRDGDLL